MGSTINGFYCRFEQPPVGAALKQWAHVQKTTVLYATTIVPFDADTLRKAVAKAVPDIIVVEPYYEGALVQNIAAALQATPTRIEAIDVPRRVLDRYGPPERHDMELGLTVEGIRARISSFLR